MSEQPQHKPEQSGEFCEHGNFKSSCQTCKANQSADAAHTDNQDKIPEFLGDKLNYDQLGAYKEYNPRGPKIGHVECVDKNNQPVSLEIHLGQRGNGLTLSYIHEGKSVGFLNLGKIDQEEIEKEKIGSPFKNYGDQPMPEGGVTYIDLMENRSGGNVKGLGKKMHETAVEYSLQNGTEGRVQLEVGGVGGAQIEPPGTSMPFHGSFGYRNQTIFNEDGSIHHTGEYHDKKLEEFLERDRKHLKENPTGEHLTHEVSIDDKPFMYLPEDVIKRETERALKDPHLEVNKATLEALMKKHAEFAQASATAREAHQTLEKLRVWNSQSYGDYISVANKFERGAKPEEARQAYGEAAELFKKSFDDIDKANWAALQTYAELLEKSGENDKAKEYYGKAADAAQKEYRPSGDFGPDLTQEEAIQKLRVLAGDEASVRADYRNW